MTPPKRLQDMPFDVYDHIFDTLRRNDVDTRKRALFAASQTCKAWAAMTRRARFHSVSLIVKLPGEESTVNFFLQDFVQKPIFARLVQDSCVKSLTLRWGRSSAWSEVDFGAILPEYLPLFPGLLALRLCGVIYKRPSQPIAQRFGGVRSLTVDGRSYSYHSRRRHHTHAFYDLLCLFPTLQKLILNDVNDWAHHCSPPLPADHPAMQEQHKEDNSVRIGINFHAGLQRALHVFFAAQGGGNGALNIGGGGAGGHEEGVHDATYDGALDVLPVLHSVVMEQSSCPPILASLLRSADVKFVDVTDTYDSDLRTVHACAATVEHFRYNLSYQMLLNIPPPLNVDLSGLHALRKLTLVVTLPAWLMIGIDLESPWRALASVLTTVRARSRVAPALDLELELALPSSVARGTDLQGDGIVAFCRQLVSEVPLAKTIDEDLGRLIDGGKAASVRVSLTARRGSAQDPHARLNELLVDAFPSVRKKGHLHLSGGCCACEKV